MADKELSVRFSVVLRPTATEVESWRRLYIESLRTCRAIKRKYDLLVELHEGGEK